MSPEKGATYGQCPLAKQAVEMKIKGSMRMNSSKDAAFAKNVIREIMRQTE